MILLNCNWVIDNVHTYVIPIYNAEIVSGSLDKYVTK